MNISGLDLSSEFVFKTSRSGGKGGQNVNKVSTKVELDFNIAESKILSEEQKIILLEKLKDKINKEGFLQVVSQKSRSQLENKENAIAKFYLTLNKAFEKRKKRIPTKISKGAKEKKGAGAEKSRGQKYTNRDANCFGYNSLHHLP